MIDYKFIKKGQKFKGQIDYGIIEITEITINYLGKTYITTKDLKTNYISQIDIKTFIHLFFTPIDDNGLEIV